MSSTPNHVSRAIAATTARSIDRRALLTTASLGLGAIAAGLVRPGGSAFAAQATPTASAPAPVGAVYAMTNGDGVGNAVVGFTRSDDGWLTYLATTPTGGEGTGRRSVPALAIGSGFNTLGSSHALIANADRTLLFAVNAGDGTVSSLAIADDFSLSVVSTVQAGTFPTSLACHGGVLVAALTGNPAAGEPTGLVSFLVADDGTLTPVEGSTVTLSDAEKTKPTDIVFSSDGAHVIVSDTMTALLTAYPVGADGLFGEPVATMSRGMGPNGTAMHPDDILVVTETQGGAATGFELSSVSTYRVGDDGSLTVISDQVPTGRTSACWVSVTPDGSRAITANTGDSTVSTFVLGGDGSATLESAVAAQQATTIASGAGASDSAISDDGAYYYQLWSGLGVVIGYAIGADGSLAPIDGGIGGGLPELGTQGIVAI